MLILFLQTVFSLLACLINFLSKATHAVSGKRTVVGRLLVCGFMFSGLGVRLCLFFGIAMVSEAKIPSNILFLSPILSLGAPVESDGVETCSSFCCHYLLLYESPIDVVLRCARQCPHVKKLYFPSSR